MKKNILLAVLIFAFVINVNAQKTEIKVGDTFKIETVENNNYKYIKFPKDNFIIKKGGIVNYSNIIGEQVKVTSIKEKKEVRLPVSLSENEISALVKQRTNAKREKNYELADRIRKDLADEGILLEDAPGGTSWKFIRGNVKK